MIGLLLISSIVTANSITITIKHAEAEPAIFVNAYSNQNSSVSYHMWTVIKDQWGNTVKTGYTPLVYSDAIQGVTYTVTISNYGSLTFDHWGVDGKGGNSNTKSWTMGSVSAWFDGFYNNNNNNNNVPSIQKLIPKTGIFTALYMYPGSSPLNQYWQQVLNAKLAHPSVPFAVVINPNSGAGYYFDQNFAIGINKLRNVGVIVLGYTYSNYANRPIDAVKTDVDKYVNWYHIDGIFIDEMQNQAGSEWYYKQISDYAHSKGMKMTMGNPGTDVAKTYIGTLDVINISEGYGYISPTLDPNLIGSGWVSGGYTGWHSQYDKRNFSYVRYGISWLDTNFEINSSQYVGLLYIHSGDDSNARWFNIPNYYAQEVATLDR